MNYDDPLELDGYGRKSGLRRFIWRPKTWQETKDELQRTVNGAPEVVIKVEGGGMTPKDIKNYMGYISRNGKLPARDDRGEAVEGKEGVNNLHDSWDTDMARGLGRLHQSFNVILSMPKDTDPGTLFAAVTRFAAEQLPNHEYMLVLHTHETDPRQPAPKHPHVHLIIKAEDRDGQRLYIRKTTLRSWREAFAAQLRAHGIEANATSRSMRGVSFKRKRGAEFHILGRGAASSALAGRFAEAADDLERADPTPKPWELAMAARRRDVVRELAANAARLHAEGDTALAGQVARFAAELPPLDTERHKMQRAIAEQVNERLRVAQDGPESDKTR